MDLGYWRDIKESDIRDYRWKSSKASDWLLNGKYVMKIGEKRYIELDVIEGGGDHIWFNRVYHGIIGDKKEFVKLMDKLKISKTT